MNINKDIVPSNLEECLKVLRKSLTPLDIEELTRKNSCSSQHHFGLGMYIRNEWSLWEKDTPLKNWFLKEYGLTHADDISGIILHCLWADIRNEPRKDKEQAKLYLNHWKEINS